MLNLSPNFRKSFLAYLKNPNCVKNKENLASIATAIYKDAVNQNNSVEPDKYLTSIHETIKSATHGIKVSPDIAKTLDVFIRELSFSDLSEEHQAFHALNVASNLTKPEKSCLRDIINNFLTLQDKLAKEDIIITNRNFAGSFFLSNSDVSNIRVKKSIIDALINATCKEIFCKSREESAKYLPISYDMNNKIQHIEKHIDSLSEKQCNQILSGLLQKINPILNAPGSPDDIRENIEEMTDSGKRSALMFHSFNDKYFFTFIAKMVKTIKEALGIKTSVEKILENSVDDAKKSGITL